LGAFQRPYSRSNKAAPTSSRSSYISARAPMTEIPSPRKPTSKKGCIALSACILLLIVVVVVSTVVGVTVSKKPYSSSSDEDVNPNSLADICNKTL
jgi:ABC-type Fe3+ transport system permease subunit